MSKGNVIRITGFLSLLLILFNSAVSQDNKDPAVRLMFYNVENLFDTYNDSLSDDDEFLPDATRRWTYGRYSRKINSLFKTIMAAGEWEPPEMVALYEIENRKVLGDLVFGTLLSKYDYSIIHEDSPDPRGIDVCIIYRKEIIRLLDYRYLTPGFYSESGFASRSVLYARFNIHSDTVHFFINHWPSRRGGVLAGEDQRRMIAEMVRHSADSVSVVSGGRAKIILAGDFNATPDDIAVNILTSGHEYGAVMKNLSEGPPGLYGTYRYMGTWETIDQVIVSESLLNSTTGLSTKSELFRVFRPDFLLKYDTRYPGLSPFSTYSGYKYQGGFSDHLPVLLDLIVR